MLGYFQRASVNDLFRGKQEQNSIQNKTNISVNNHGTSHFFYYNVIIEIISE